MRRTPNETIAQLLVREEELFVDLQQSLRRARNEREGLPPPPHMWTSPSQSLTVGPAPAGATTTGATTGATAAGTTSTSSPTRTMADDSSSPILAATSKMNFVDTGF